MYCMYVVYVCIVCMVCMVCMYVLYVCMYCMYVCMHLMYLCMYVYMYVYIVCIVCMYVCTDSYDMIHHSYADDTQLIDQFKADSIADTLHKTAKCTKQIKAWMTQQMLKLNDDKTEVMLVGTNHQLNKIDCSHMTIGDSQVPISTSVKNLGVILDSDLSMSLQVDNLCRICYFHLRAIGNIRHQITSVAAHTLVRSLVLSRLDYCNSILIGLNTTQLQKLQKLQNTAARIITLTSRNDHITPVLKSLHWLPVRARIDYKLLCIAYQCLHNTAPSYLTDLVEEYKPTRTLRSLNQGILTVLSQKLKSFGHRTFSYTAAILWNALPLKMKQSPSLPSFKATLKTHLFKIHYNC